MMIIKIDDGGGVSIESNDNEVTSFKQIAPDSLLECLNKSIVRGSVTTGVLPKNTVSCTIHDNGERDIALLHSENRANIRYYDTEYMDFPLPRLLFGFSINQDGRVGPCRLGVVDTADVLKPDIKLFHYPFSNVSGFHLCIGSNLLPKCTSLHTLSSLPYHILAMPNNDDSFRSVHNKLGFDMRELLEHLKDKDPRYYYDSVLVPSGLTLNEFITKV